MLSVSSSLTSSTLIATSFASTYTLVGTIGCISLLEDESDIDDIYNGNVRFFFDNTGNGTPFIIIF